MLVHYWTTIYPSIMEYFSMFPGYVDLAMKTTLSLREYEDVLDPADIYSLLGSVPGQSGVLCPC